MSYWDVELGQATICFGVIIFFTLAAMRIFRRQGEYQVPARDVTKGHRWCYSGPFSEPVFCNVCEMLIGDGLSCDSCGVCADQPCLRKANKILPCKSLAQLGTTFKHHWIKGNLPSNSICSVCDVDCSCDGGMHGYRCCWCQRTVHEQCQQSLSVDCDLGRYRNFIVPPNCIRLRLVGWKGRRHLVVGEVKPPTWSTWTPLIVIGNRKSGSNDGEQILKAFRSVLNPAQVIDLHDLPPESGLEWCHLVNKFTCRVLIAGGDGTIGWVLTAINNLKLQPQPQVAIIPVGTGNDLSRVLGWGDGSKSGSLNAKRILEMISAARQVQLDRWKIRITPTSHLRIRFPSKELFMNNYASVGVDALVTLNFHKTRESKLYLFGSRLLNKLLFVSYGTKDIWERECKDLHKKVELWLDDNRVELPEIEAIVILNIPCWGGGVRPWELGATYDTPKQRFDDGVVEVFGVYSSFHIAQMQVGLSEPVRIGRAKSVKLKLLEKVPMQVDGEPWEQHPGEIQIQFHERASMLSCVSE